MLEGYSALAPVYDRLNENVSYPEWADYIEKCMKYRESGVGSVLELGCGTGSMTLELARRGYDIVALDISDEMLSVADERLRAEGLTNALLVHGDMTSFELYGTVDCAICCLDGINHLTTRDDLYACFALVSNYLNPDGLFIFDVNTPHKFESVYADRDYILEGEGAVCCWQNRLSGGGKVADFFLTVFTENSDGTWSREDGVTRERAYGLRSLKNALESNGMELITVSSAYDFNDPAEDADRWYITARKK